MPTIEEAAKRLAESNAEYEPNIQEIYWFPAPDQIRLIEVDTSTVPSNQVNPFYFQRDGSGQIPYPFAIALIRPEERGSLTPPEAWGSWDEAKLIWRKDG